MTKHQLKTWPEFFQAVIDGIKTFEVRINDRDFKVGDILELQEYVLDTATYTGRSTEVIVTYMMQDVTYLLHPQIGVMSVKLTEGSKLRAQKATSSDPAHLEKMAVLADRVMNEGPSHYCLECGKQWFGDSLDCGYAHCVFRKPSA